MAGALSDQAWAEISATAKREPDAKARAVLSAVLLEEYPAFTFDRAAAIAAQARVERMLENLDKFASEYRALFTQADDIEAERGRWCIEALRRHIEAALLTARIKRRAYAGRQDPQRVSLYHWLCTVWLNHFHGIDLSYDTSGGEPHGPLVEFILAAMRQVMPEDALPARWTVRDAIDDEVFERAHFEQELEKERLKQERDNAAPLGIDPPQTPPQAT
jgi:hypothetical protein